jgi:hypothetical protein
MLARTICDTTSWSYPKCGGLHVSHECIKFLQDVTTVLAKDVFLEHLMRHYTCLHAHKRDMMRTNSRHWFMILAFERCQQAQYTVFSCVWQLQLACWLSNTRVQTCTCSWLAVQHTPSVLASSRICTQIVFKRRRANMHVQPPVQHEMLRMSDRMWWQWTLHHGQFCFEVP